MLPFVSPMTPEDVAYSFWRVLLMADPNTPGFLMTEPFFKVLDAAELVDPSGALDGDAVVVRQLRGSGIAQRGQSGDGGIADGRADQALVDDLGDDLRRCPDVGSPPSQTTALPRGNGQTCAP